MRASRTILPTLAATALLLAIGAAGAAAPPAATGDAAKGKIIFARCAICHAVTPGTNKLGPSLAGVVGRKAASVPGFAYSAAMKGSGIVWTPAQLDAYLVNPSAKVPGTKMVFAGLPTPADRANVVAYLQTAK